MSSSRVCGSQISVRICVKVNVRCACVRVCGRVGSAVCEGVGYMERAI